VYGNLTGTVTEHIQDGEDNIQAFNWRDDVYGLEITPFLIDRGDDTYYITITMRIFDPTVDGGYRYADRVIYSLLSNKNGVITEEAYQGATYWYPNPECSEVIKFE